jgi:DNA/RNA endonuclease G (NUC1)
MSCTNSLEELKNCSNYAVVQNGSWAFPEVLDKSLVLYTPGQCPGDHISPEPENVHYFTLVSKKRNQPVFTLWANGDETTEQYAEFLEQYGSKRPSFNTCCIAGITAKDYSGTGFSRGHQVAMADMGLMNQANSTFTTCNMSPQNEPLNGNQWAKLELASRKCAEDASVVVYTGPMFKDGGKYCMKGTNTVCQGNNCEALLHPPKGSPDWFNQTQYYDLCDESTNQVPVPTAFYKVVCFKDSVYPIIMAQEVPGDMTGTNTKILATGSTAWSMIQNELQNYIRFPDVITQNVKESDSETWLSGNCPSSDNSSLMEQRLTQTKSSRTSRIIVIVVGSLLLLLLLALLIWYMNKESMK